MLFLLRKKWFWLTLLIIFVVNFLWPVRHFFSAKFLFNEHLVILTNEAELRPCGGFATVYGKLRILPPRLELKNVYTLKNANFGKSPQILQPVAQNLKFWDLGTETDLTACTKNFYQAAQEIDLAIDDVILVDTKTIEEIIGDPHIFANFTRQVANVDRHDEESLKKRKSPLADLGKKVLLKTIFQPWKWAKISRKIEHAVANGNIFVKNVSPEIAPTDQDFSVTEWNLGGGKSSRFLQKNLEISLRETAPQNWQIQGKLAVEHLGQADEPLSQNWQGVFELKFPTKFAQENLQIPAKIKVGDTWETDFSFDYQGEINDLSIFNPRGQTLFLNLKVSLFGQQTFAETNFSHHENIGYFYQKTTKFREKLAWQVAKDQIKPFVTLHEWNNPIQEIPAEKEDWSKLFLSSAARFSVAEIHFSEKVNLSEKTTVEIIDKNHENKEINENPVFQDIVLLPNRQTALVLFKENKIQSNERFSLKFRGIFDDFGNEISLKKYTIIDRINSEK